MTSRTFLASSRSALLVVVLAATPGCGDTTSELITGPAASGSTTGGAAGAATSGSGGTAGSGSGSGGTGNPECTSDTAAAACTDDERRFCHPTRLVCVECIDEGQCDANEDCSDDLGECAVPCASSDDCTDDDDRVCDPLLHFCVECLADADCPSNRCSNWECG